jgi:hypothetical protein
MVSYGQVTRTPGQPSQVREQVTPPEIWDDSEERELEFLAKGASALAWRNMNNVDKAKADQNRKEMLNEVRKSK